MKNKGDLAFKLILLGIAAVLTAIWLGSAAYTWPKANELAEVHLLPYPSGPDLAGEGYVREIYSNDFLEGVKVGTITQARTTKALIRASSSSNHPPYDLVIQGLKDGQVVQAQFLGKVDYLNFAGLYPDYKLEKSTLSGNQVVVLLKLTNYWWWIHALIAVVWIFCAGALVSIIREI